MKRNSFIAAVFLALLVFLPVGTRFIWRSGVIAGSPVEAGTISLFGTQLLAAVFALSVFLSARAGNLRGLFRRPFVLLPLILAAVAIVSLLLSAAPLQGAPGVAWLILGVFVFSAIIIYRPNLRTAFIAFIVGALLQSALGIWQFLAQSAWSTKWLGMASHDAFRAGAVVIETATGRWLRAYGSLPHPNMLGFVAAAGTLICVGLYAEEIRKRRIVYLMALPVLAAGAFFSFSRSAFLGLLLGAVLLPVAAAFGHFSQNVRGKVFAACAVAAVTFAVLAAFFPEPVMTRSVAAGRLERLSLEERVASLSDAASLFEKHPLLGVGMGRMPFAAHEELDKNRNAWQYQYAHDLPALIAVEIGVIGLVVWLVFVALLLRALMFRPSASGDELGRMTLAAVVAVMLAAAAFDHFLWSSWFGQAAFWIFSGLSFAAAINSQKDT